MPSSVHRGEHPQTSGTKLGRVRFAFKTSPQNTTWAEMLPIWQAADDIDVFESGWTFDHFYPIFSDSTGPCLEGWITLTALAQATKRLRVGVLVTGIHYRHPAVLANMAAALDVISNGRLELGIGAGWNEEESGAYGIELGTIKERFDRFEEACEVLTSLLTNETTTFDGKYYQLKDARNEPKGPQQPHPADLHRRQWREAHPAAHREVRRPLELRRRHAGGVRAQARRAGRPLRGHRPRPEGDHALGARAARRGPRLREGRRRGRGAGQRGPGSGDHLPAAAATTRRCWNRWPRRSGIRGSPRRSVGRAETGVRTAPKPSVGFPFEGGHTWVCSASSRTSSTS